MTRNDATPQPASVLVELPCRPLARDSAEHRVVNVKHVVLVERQLSLGVLGVAFETNSNVEGVTGLAFDLIEFYKRFRLAVYAKASTKRNLLWMLY